MSCRRPATKNLTRKSRSCCNSRYDSDSTSDSSSDYSDSSFSSSSDSSCDCFDCDCYDCFNDSPKRRKGKGKAKRRVLQPKKTSKPCKSPSSTKKKQARRTKGSCSGSASSCNGSKGDCSDEWSSDNEYSNCSDCKPLKSRPKARRAPKRPRQRRIAGSNKV